MYSTPSYARRSATLYSLPSTVIELIACCVTPESDVIADFSFVRADLSYPGMGPVRRTALTAVQRTAHARTRPEPLGSFRAHGQLHWKTLMESDRHAHESQSMAV